MRLKDRRSKRPLARGETAVLPNQPPSHMKTAIPLVLIAHAFAATLTAGVLLDDTFEDSSLDASKWTRITTTGEGSGFSDSVTGSSLVEASGVLTIAHAASNHGGGVQTAVMSVNDQNVVTIDRIIRVHYANDYTSQFEHLYSETGVRLMSWGYYNYTYNTSRLGFGPYEGPRLPGVWDQWISETITYDPSTGAGSYTINGTYDGSGNLTNAGAGTVEITSGLPLAGDSSGISLKTGAYGWHTGHTKEFQSVTISQDGVPSGVFADIDGYVYTSAVQADGRILIGGEFTQVDGVNHSRVARLFADGSFDSDFVPPRIAGTVNSLVVLPDGDILVGGDFLCIDGTDVWHNLLRLNSDGSLDTDFLSDPDGEVTALALQADGKVIVAGAFSAIGGGGWSRLARIEADGGIDGGFLASGVDDAVHVIVVQPDGKIVVGGDFTAISGVSRAGLARLEDTGFPEAGFSADVSGSVQSLALQADGRILVGGEFSSVGGVARENLARLNADGTVDLAFSTAADWVVSSLAVQADGDILLGGWFTVVAGQARNNLAKLDAAGALDGGFVPEPDLPPLTLSLLEDGRLFAGGAFTSIGGGNQANAALLGNEAAAGSLEVYGLERVEWLRGGGAPEVGRVEFEVTNDGGATWTLLGAGTRIAGGWELDELALSGSGKVRARGFVGDGSFYNGSGILEAVADYPVYTVTFALGSGASRTGGGELVQRVPGGEGAVAPEIAMTGDWMFAGWDGEFDVVTEDLTITAVTVLPGFEDADYAGSANGIVRSMAVQPDGKVLVAGDFSEIGGGSQPYLARLHVDGSLDASFAPVFNSRVHTVALQGDGKVVVGGAFTTVNGVINNYCARLESDGGYDAGFVPQVGGQVYAVALQEDGKILVGGYFSSAGGVARSNLARYYPDGSLDADFHPRPNGAVYCLALEADGDVLAGGSFSSVTVQLSATSSAGYTRTNLARFASDGSLDVSFSPNPNGFVTALVPLANGQLYVGGSFTAIDGSGMANLSRLNADGSLDGSFWPNPNAQVSSLALQEDGKLLVGGTFTSIKGNSSFPRLARVDGTGAIDMSFRVSYNGSPFSTGANVMAIALQEDGKVLAGGMSYNYLGWITPYFERLWNQPATREEPVLTTDRLEWAWGGTSPQASRMEVALSVDGGASWHVVGPAEQSATGWEMDGLGLLGAGQLRLRAFVSDGSFYGGSGFFEEMVSFDFGGEFHLVTFDPGDYGRRTGGGYLTQLVAPGGAATAPELAVSDGWVFDGWSVEFDEVAGDLAVVGTYSVAPGEVDPGYAPVVNSDVYCSAVLPDGKVVIGGWLTSVDGQQRMRLARLNADGSLDDGFAPVLGGAVYAVMAYPDGSVLVGGDFQSVNGITRYRIARLLADGSLDEGFTASANATVRCIEREADGSILIGGDFTNVSGFGASYLARLSETGVVDTGFRPNPNARVWDIAALADGRMYVCGDFTAIPPYSRERIVRLNADGSLDTTFYTGASSRVTCLAVQPDGKVVFGGAFTAIIGASRQRLARVLPTGAVDSSFVAQASGTVYTIALQADGRILIGGEFGTVNGYTARYFARLAVNGSPESGSLPEPNGLVYAASLQDDGAVVIGGAFIGVGTESLSRCARIVLEEPVEQLAVPGPGRVVWLRDGTAPEVGRVEFAYSADGGDSWQELGEGVRVDGGWELSGLGLEPAGSVRARAFVESAAADESGGIHETVMAYDAHVVRFELTEKGFHGGGGDLEQFVSDGGAAVEPVVTPALGWEFAGWDQDFGVVAGDVDVTALYQGAEGSFHAWLEGEGLQGDPAVLFDEPHASIGLPNGVVYALGDNLAAGEPELTLVLQGDRRIVEVIPQDPATVGFVELEVLGAATLREAAWDLPLAPSTDVEGKPENRDWHEQVGEPEAKAFFRLGAKLRE